jgi:hypothetical protein
MQLTTILPDESVEALAIRVYDLGEKPSQSSIRAAVRRLRDANPALRRMADAQPGMVVEVPPLEDGAHRSGATVSEDAVAAGIVRDHIGAAAALLGRQLFEDLSAELSETDETLKLARSPELRRAKAPGLAEALREAVAAAEARAAGSEELRSRRKAVLGQLAADLRDLTGAHGGEGNGADADRAGDPSSGR